MKLLFVKWKKTICLSMITVLIFLGIKAAYNDFSSITPQLCCASGNGAAALTAQVSGEHDKISIMSCFVRVTCRTESMLLEGKVQATVKPTGMEIYRAKIKSNGKNGKFKKIVSSKNLILTDDMEGSKYAEWAFNYEDSTVKTGNAYAYKCKVYYKTGRTYQYQQYSKVKKGMAAKTVGAYTCIIVENTDKKLVVKLTGKSKKNGLLEAQYSPGASISRSAADLRYKNDGENEIHRILDLIKYSYNGKKWYTGERFAIKGKQSVYLYFKEYVRDWDNVNIANGINFSNYQYAQMFFYTVKYNLQCQELYNRFYSPQIRFNLSAGTAAVSDFISWNEVGDPAFVWDGDIFTRDYDLID